MTYKEFLINAQRIKFKDCFNIVRYFYDYCLKPECVSFNPFFVRIETTTRCNLGCKLCVNRSLINKKDMSFGQFKIILDKFPYVKTLSLTGSGEPFLNKDIFNMIKYA
ncbi:MAG: hypothetical protein RAP41_04410, partial [Candidatus Orphnella occulta]|nr:hypothetical protein [Candidatus Orphnella occulta]